MLKLENFYPENYYQAREKFLESVCEYKTDNIINKPVLEDLVIDTAVFEPQRDKETLLLFTSGTHGVEGYVGTAVQLFILENFLNLRREDIGMAFVHSINPFGYANDRRVNESNVDLNRNFIDNPDDFKMDDEQIIRVQDYLFPLLTPMQPIKSLTKETLNLILNIFKAKKEYGMDLIKSAIAGGQYRFPESIFYGGGDKLEKSAEIYREIIKEVSQGYSRVIGFDVHSGLGKWKECSKFTSEDEDSYTYRKLNGIFPEINNVSNDTKTKSKVYKIKGGIGDYTAQHSRSPETCFFGLEFGTYNVAKVLRTLIQENQVYHYPDSNEGVKRVIKEDMQEIFCPSDKSWRYSVLGSTYNVMMSLDSGFRLFR
ncbi:MAG: DUF2817 domain-containing protein [Nanoarchaeota archaeon]